MSELQFPNWDLTPGQKKLVGSFKEFTMPIIRSGFPSQPLNMIFSKQPITPNIRSEQVQPESDDFVLTGAL